ncbi:hypothetical protein [Streptomyces sp. NPDC090022]|uniref:hypothetical protein n=1 Tax=Streptomyces sp. NPDC090022 TaxID=3365920 RepID=UPI00381879F3
MRTSTRFAGVLAGLVLALGGAAFTVPAAHADVSECVDVVERELQGGEAPEAVRMACEAASTGAHEGCVDVLGKDYVSDGTAVSACTVAP